MIRSIAIRAGILAGLWWLMTGGAPGSWLIGVPAIAAATAASWRLRAPGGLSLSLAGMAAFTGFFVVESLRGGLDVARRAFARPVDVQPGFLVYRTSLPRGLPRLLLSSSISLLPGTLTVELRGDELVVHTLAMHPDPRPGVKACENRIRRAFVADRDAKHGVNEYA